MCVAEAFISNTTTQHTDPSPFSLVHLHICFSGMCFKCFAQWIEFIFLFRKKIKFKV